MNERAVTIQDGQIFWRGAYRSRDEAERLAQEFEAVTDWFKPTAQGFARELRAALAETSPMEQAA